MSPGAASVGETDLMIVGFTSSWFVTVLLATGVVWSESTVPLFGIMYGVAEIGSERARADRERDRRRVARRERAEVHVTVPAALAAGDAAGAAHVVGVRRHESLTTTPVAMPEPVFSTIIE